MRCGFGVGAGGSALSVRFHLPQPSFGRRPVRMKMTKDRDFPCPFLDLNKLDGFVRFSRVVEGILCSFGATVPDNQHGICHIHHLRVALKRCGAAVHSVTRTNNILGKTVPVCILLRQGIYSVCTAADDGIHVRRNIRRQVECLDAS